MPLIRCKFVVTEQENCLTIFFYETRFAKDNKS